MKVPEIHLLPLLRCVLQCTVFLYTLPPQPFFFTVAFKLVK